MTEREMILEVFDTIADLCPHQATKELARNTAKHMRDATQADKQWFADNSERLKSILIGGA